MGAGTAKAAAPGGGVDAGGGGKSEQGAKGYCRKGEAMREKCFRRRWSVRQKFFQTWAGKRLQSAVYELCMLVSSIQCSLRWYNALSALPGQTVRRRPSSRTPSCHSAGRPWLLPTLSSMLTSSSFLPVRYAPSRLVVLASTSRLACENGTEYGKKLK